MAHAMTAIPVVMTIAAQDPCGGGGISADIETLNSLGCHCTPIISRLAARDTRSTKDQQITTSSLLIEQIRAVLEDMRIDLLKIGDIGSRANTEAVHTILTDYPQIPVVMDPVLADDEQGLANAIRELLLPLAEVVILNEKQAYGLAQGGDTLASCAQELLDHGCENLLLTDISDGQQQVCNQWFSRRGLQQQYHWQRLPADFQGAGSTLSAALSAYLAHHISLTEAIQQAQQFTWQALQQARRLGMGQLLPNRMHWCKH